MFKSYYKLKIVGKDVKRFIKMLYKLDIFFEEIEFNERVCFIKIDKESYKKLCDVKTSYDIELVDVFGFRKLEMFFKKNIIFILSFIVGILFLFFLSNLIFEIEVVHTDSYIRELVLSELNNYDIKKYSLLKDYDYIEKVKKNILNNHKDMIEWLEIERIGTKYKIRVEKRVIKDINESNVYQHIIAKKPAIIMKIRASNGEVIKKINDYVKAGDIIISGNIFRNGNVIDNVAAKGEVFGEVWYKVKVDIPKDYKEEILTGKSDKLINISFFNNSVYLLGNLYEKNVINEKIFFKDFFSLFSIKFNTVYESVLNDNDISSIAVSYARDKISNNLRDGEYIISQKKLKTTINNSTISTEIFFKVYENISSSLNFSIEEGL